MKNLFKNRKWNWLMMLFLVMLPQQMKAEYLLSQEVTVDGVVYFLSRTAAIATASRLAENFVGTKVVLADSVQGIWEQGAVRPGWDLTDDPRLTSETKYDTLMFPVVRIEDGLLQGTDGITSLTLPKHFSGNLDLYSFDEDGRFVSKYCRTLNSFLPKSLKEILVSEGNTYFTSNNGLLCNITGDTLLRVPNSYVEDGKMIIPEGIHCIPRGAYSGIYTNNIILNDTVSFFDLANTGTVTFKNIFPPSLRYGGYDIVLKVPSGSSKMYYDYFGDTKPIAIIEEGGPIQHINRHNFIATALYDTNSDGNMELIGLTNKKSLVYVKNGEYIDRDSIVYDSRYSTPQRFKVDQQPNSDKLEFSFNDGSYTKTLLRQTGNKQYEGVIDDYSLYVDIDNDGLKDIVGKYGDEFYIYMQQADGSFIKTKQHLTENLEESKINESGSMVTFLQGFLRNSMFVDDAPSPFQHLEKVVDFNNDGILDIIDDIAGGIMYSYADGKYYVSKSKEIVYPVDIDNDGVQDYVVFDGETLYLITNVFSTSSEKKELFKNSKIDKVLFKDFDLDGDIDILAFINDKKVNQGTYQYTSYFVFLRNNGDGSFRRKEFNMSETQYSLVDCRDVDADGLYELVVCDNSYDSGWKIKNDHKLFKVNKDLTLSEYPLTLGILSETYEYTQDLQIGDFDNDGYTEFYYNRGDVYGHLNSQTVQNTAPKKMDKPVAFYDAEANRLKITWNRGEDKETSICDLTYALRIGSAPGQDDIMRPASLSDGRRKTICDGEQGTALSTLFNVAGLKAGKYYISVQTIDAGGLGGLFSDELEYEHKLAAPKFFVSASELSTADTLEVYFKSVVADATYNWSVSEGEIIEQTGNSAKIIFHRSGQHEIKLAMTVGETTYKSNPQIVDVASMKVQPNSRTNYLLFDINQDGFIDGYSSDYYKVITMYRNDNGSLTPIQLSTFSDLNGTIRFITDYNHDGYPDFVIDGCSKGNVFLNYGEQDFDFDYQTKNLSIGYHYGQYYLGQYIDLNNDGWPDCHYNGWFYYSKDKLSSYDSWAYHDVGYYRTVESYVYDVNRDGFPDIVWMEDTDESTVWYVRLKNNSVDCSYSEPKVLFKLSGEMRRYYHKIDNTDPEKYEYIYEGNNYNGSILADFNNDGYPDLAVAMNNQIHKYPYSGNSEETNNFTFYVIKGNPDGESSEIALKIDDVYRISSSAFDIDNDGYLDIPTFVMHAKRKWNGWNDDFSGETKTLFLKKEFGYELSNHGSGEADEIVSMGDEIISLTGSNYYNSLFSTKIPNQSPVAPETVAVKQTQEGMLITWSDAIDKETPAMQMRYNISVKRKGKKGDDAFVISPMNGLKDEAAIVPGYGYKKSTQMLIPASVLTAGETYEVQVQAIDLWGAHSPMTKSVELTMGNNGYIDVVERTTTNKETIVKFVGTQANSYSLNTGEGGKIVKDNGNGEYLVSWSTEGVKELTLTAGSSQIKSSITVVKPFDLTFTVPQLVLAGTPVTIKASPDMATASAYTGWHCDDSSVEISYAAGDENAYITFPKVGTYTLEAYSTDSIRGGSYSTTLTITETMPEATIQRSDVYEGYYYVMWDETVLPSYINKVVVLKESNSLNQFLVVDTISATKGYYIDFASDANVAAQRYSIMLLANNGQVSCMSGIHKPLHVMLGYSTMGGFNLMWNNYEGLIVDNYQIWRGSTPDNMALLAQVAGSQQNYTDISPMDGINYYSIVFNPKMTSESMHRAAPLDNDGPIRSNCVSTQKANRWVLANSIEIINGNDVVLTENNSEIRLRCNILPAYASVDKVSWSIIEGSDLAVIDNEGRLRATGGKGTIKVCAKTLDGSDLTAEISVKCDIQIYIPGDINVDGLVDISDAVSVVNCILSNVTNHETLQLYDVNGDGEIDIFDVTMIINIILTNKEPIAERRALADDTAMERAHLTANSNRIWMGIDHADRFTAFQFNVEVPEGVSLEGAKLTDTTKSHQLHMAKTGENLYTIVGLSMNNELLSIANEYMIELQLSGKSDVEVCVSDILFVTPSEKTSRFYGGVIGMSTGISNINTMTDNDNIYDMSGRKLNKERSQLGRGVYVINNKKVVIK